MKKAIFTLTLVAALATSACRSGPSSLSYQVDDWRNQNYVDEPAVTAIFTDIIPFYPLVTFLAGIPDWLILNPIQFWGSDLWDGRGAGFYSIDLELWRDGGNTIFDLGFGDDVALGAATWDGSYWTWPGLSEVISRGALSRGASSGRFRAADV